MHSRFVVCPVHVGRAVERRALEAALDAVMSGGTGQTLLIAGEAGVGKSRMAAEAMSAARARGFQVTNGPCIEGAASAYAPLVTALRRHIRRLDTQTVNECFGGTARLAASLLPEVDADLGGIATAPNLSPEDLDAAVWQLLSHIAMRGPVLLVLEDLQWAGADMLRMFASLVRDCADLRLLLVATYRTDELHRQHPLTATLAELSRGRCFEELRLEPLDGDSLRTMLSAIFDSTVVGDGFLDAVLARSGGNPFFVEELCRVLLERGDVFLAGGDWSRRELADIELPSTVRAALLARTHHVPAPSLAALRVAAVAGEVIDPAVLARATGLHSTAVARVVSDGINYQLVQERREESGPVVAFRHNLTRELLARELVGPERQEAHRSLAAALEEIHADDIDTLAGSLADHHLQGGNTTAAAAFAVQAARTACTVRAPHEMLARYEQAIRLTPRRDPQRLDLLLEAAEATVGVSDRRVATSMAGEARDLAIAADDRVAAARAFRVLSQVRWWEGDAAGSVALGQEARALLEGRGDRWEVWALSYLARRCALLDRDDEARELVARALPMAEGIGQLSAVSWLHDTLAVLGGDEATVAAEWSAALDAARAAGDEPQQLTVLTNSGYVALWHGDLPLAASRFSAAMELATRLVTPFEAHAGVGLGWVQALRGELTEALSTVARHQRTTDLPNTLDALTALVEAHLRRGDRTTAASLADEQWRLAQSTGESQTMVPALASLARARLASGLEPAGAVFEDALTHASAGASGRQLHWTFTPDFAQALQAAGDLRRLATWVDAVRAMTSGAADHRHNRAALHLCEGLLAALHETHEDACTHLAAAAQLYSEVPCPARQAESLLALAAAEGGRNHDAARAAAAQAQALAAAHGMPDLLAAADAALRRAGVRVPGRRRPAADSAAVGGLSEREREVAVLVAQGLSNAEVARRLFLSERTARNHVSNILAKLELRSRAEVARWAVQHGLLDEARSDSLTG